MATDRMYELAFQYKKTKLWKKLSDTDIFAVRLSDGEIGYCCVMGMAGKENAIALYPGAQAFQSYRELFEMALTGMPPEAADQDILFSQNCLQCSFENKDFLQPDELDEVRAYTKKRGITLRGANAFPQFIKYKPYYHPWCISSEPEQQYICEALEACIAAAELLEKKDKRALGFYSYVPDASAPDIPFLEKRKDGYIVTRIPLPEEIPAEYPSPTMKNEITLARLKRMKKKGSLECRMVRLPMPIQESEGMPPYYPVFLAAVDTNARKIYPTQPVLYLEEQPQDLLDTFAEMLLKAEICPKAVCTDDRRTFEMLKNLCSAAEIRFTLTEYELPDLEDAIDNLMSAMLTDPELDDEDEESLMFEAFDMIMSLSDHELKQLPREMIMQTLELAEAGLLPPEIELKVRRALRK